MKIIPTIAFTSLISLLANTANAIDWTNYLKPMQQGCQSPSFGDKFPKDLPKAYQQSIVKVTQKGKKPVGDSDGEYAKIYTLKNSTAFGQPLTAIERLQGTEWGHWKLTFANANFLTLRPQFKAPTSPDSAVENNNSQGYSSIDGDLKFDKKTNSIMCTYGQF